MRIIWNIFDYKLVFYWMRTNRTRGISSRIPQTLSHVLFLDYDDMKLEILEDEVNLLIQVCELGDCHIIETSKYEYQEAGDMVSGKYHVECLEHFGVDEILAIQNMSSCDLHFKRGPTMNQTRGWIHRRSEKGDKKAPKYVKRLESPFNGVRLQSSWHHKTLERDFDIEITLVNPDGGVDGYEDEYETMRR